MDDSKAPATGEIFSGSQPSAYAEATSPLNESYEQQPAAEVPAPSAEGVQADAGSGNAPPPEGDFAPPPSFTQSSIKKYIILAIILLFIIAIIIFIVRFVSRIWKKPEQPAVANVTLTYWGLWEDKQEIMQPIIDEYQKAHPNVTITYTMEDPKQYRERLSAAFDRGEGPDIFRFHNTWVPMFTKQLQSMPATVYSEDEYAKTFYPVVLSDLKTKSGIVGVPLEIDGLVLFYNEDLLKSANVDVPKTWVDVQDAVEKITVKQGATLVTSAIALGLAENVEHFSDILALMMLQNGTRPQTSLTTCSDKNTKSCAVEALAFYHKFAEEPTATWNSQQENSILAFAGGTVAMVIAPTWQAHTITAINPTLPFKIAPVPQLPCEVEPCAKVHWATYWAEGVNVKGKNSQAAWEFIKYLSSADTVQKLYARQVEVRKIFGEPYARVELGQMLQDNQYLAPLIESAPYMKSFYGASRTQDGDTGINTTVINYFRNAVNSLSKNTSPETAISTADTGLKQVFARWGITPAPTQ